jgi:glyoxylase-like metal-dependent hydrolase (beta-lactamase superfamily II)
MLLGPCTLSLLAACGGEAAPPAAPLAPPPEPAAVAAPTVPVPAAPVEAAPQPAKLTLQVVTGTPEGFLVNSTLVTGPKEVVVIDSQFTLADGKKLADAVSATKKTLTHVFVTHYHPDHYFGFVSVKEAFPNAKLVALPSTVDLIQKTWADKVKQWKPLYKDAIPDKPILPEPLSGTSLSVDGVALEIVGDLQGDSADNAYVHLPSLKTVIAGDLVYDGVFPWTAETTPESRKAWSESLDKLSALAPAVVVPGHQKVDKRQEPQSIDFTRTYLKDFEAAVAASKKPADVQTKIKTKYPDAALDVVLKLGAEAAFSKPKPASGKK